MSEAREALRRLWSAVEGCPTCCNLDEVDEAFEVLRDPDARPETEAVAEAASEALTAMNRVGLDTQTQGAFTKHLGGATENLRAALDARQQEGESDD